MKKNLRKLLAVFLSADMALFPAIASAQQAAPSIVIDNHTMPSAPAPNLDRTANGVQQLNIATPNGAGLSHNMFTEYGVEQKGLILNNATKAAQTQLGGYVYGNANLNGTSAKVILNEVTGPHASQMLGTTEVAGQSANVVVANPNGITCNGCGFVNTSRVTLASGHSEIDTTGKLAALKVQDGYVAFEGQGGNFTAVPVLDILSRRVTFNAQVNAQKARLVVGQNRIDYKTGQVHPLDKDGSPAPAFAIDSTALGGLYAGQISMLVNEAGAGVRVNGTMAANAGDMTLTADGQLVLNGKMSASGRVEMAAGETQQAGSIQSGASTQLTSTGAITQAGQIDSQQGIALSATTMRNTGSLKAAGGAGIRIAARNDVRNSGTLAASGGALSASAQSIGNETGGVLAAQGQLDLQSAGDIANSGQIASQGSSVALRANGRFSQSGGELAAQGGALSITANAIANDETSRIASRDATHFTATQFGNAGSIIAGQDLSFENSLSLANSGNIQAYSLSGAALQSLSNSGTIQAVSGVMSFSVQTALRNSGTLYGATGATIRAGGALDNSDGQIGSGNGAVSVTAGSVANNRGMIIASSGALGLTVSGDIDNSDGTLSAKGGPLSVSAQALTNNGAGVIYASGPLTATLAHYNATQGASLASDAALDLTASGGVQNDGQILSAQGMTLSAQGGLVNDAHGQMVATTGGLSITAQGAGLTNNGQLGTLNAGAVSLTGARYAGAGLVQSADSLTLRMDGLASVGGSLLAGKGDLSLTAGTLSSTGQIGGQNGLLSVSVQDALRNSGTLYGATGATFRAGGALDNSDGQIGAGSGAVSVTAGSVANNRGRIIASAGALGLTVSGDIDNSDGTLSARGGALSVSAQALTNNGSGVIYASGPLTATLAQYRAAQGASLASDATLDLTASGNVQNQGLVQSASAMSVKAEGGLDNGSEGRIIASDGNLDISAQGSGLNNDGKIGTVNTGTVQVRAAEMTGAGLIQSADGLDIAAVGNVAMTGSLLAGRGNLTLLFDDFSSSGEIGAQAGALRLSSRNTLRNSGTLYGATGTTIKAGSALDNSDGQIGSGNGAVSVTAGSVANNRGMIIASSGALGLTVSGDIDNSDGTLSAKGGPLSVSAQALTNNGAGVIYASGPLTATLAHYNATQGASLASDAALDLTASGGVQNDGQILSAQGMTLSAQGGLVNDAHGQMVATTGGLSITAQGAGLTNNGQLGTLNAGAVSLTGARYAGAGLVQSADSLTLRMDGLASVGGSLLAGKGDLSLTAGTLSSTGQIGGQNGLLSVSVQEALRNSGTLYGATGTTIRASGALDNSDGQIGNGNGSIMITSAALLNHQGKIISPKGSVSLISGDVDNRAGTIQGQDKVTATVSALDNRNGGAVLSLGSDLILQNGENPLSSILNQGGTIGATSVLSLATQHYESDAGSSLLGNAGMALSVSGDLDNQGIISSGTDLVLTADRLINGAGALIAAKNGNLTLTTNAHSADALSNRGIIQSSTAGKTLTIVTAGLTNTGNILGNGDVTVFVSDAAINTGKLSALDGSLTLNAASLQNGGTMAASDLLSLQLSSSVLNEGTFYGAQGVTMAAGTLANRGEGQIGADTGTVSIDTGSLTNVGGTILSTRRDLQIKTDTLLNEGGILQGQTGQTIETASLTNRAGGQILTRDGALDIADRQGMPSTAVVNDASTLQASSMLSLKANSLTNSNGTILTTAGGMDLALSGDGALDNTGGIIQSAGNLSVGAGAYTGSIASMLTSSGDMGLSLSGDVVNAGHIDAGGNLALAAHSITNLVGQSADSPAVISTKGQTLALTAQAITNAGAIQASGDLSTLTLEASGLQNSGTIAAQRDIGASITGSLGNKGTFVSRQGALTLAAQDVANSGFLGSVAQTRLTVQNGATNSGVIYADAGVVARMAGQFDNTGGQIGTASGDITLDAARIINGSGRIIAQGGLLTLTGTAIANKSGVLQADGSVELAAPQFDNTQGLVLSKSASVSIGVANAIDRVTNTQGIIQGNGPVSIGFTDLANDNGQILTQAGDLALRGSGNGSVTNTNGAIQATGAVTLDAGSYQGGENSQVTSGQSMGLTVTNEFINAGKIASVGDLTVQAGSVSNDQHGIMASTQGNLALTSGAALINRGVIQTEASRSLLSVRASSLENAAQAGIVANGNATLVLQGALDNAGEITARGNQLTLNAMQLTNSNLMLSGGALSLSLPGDLTNNGLIYGLADVMLNTANTDNRGGQIGSGQGLVSLTASSLRNDQGGRIIGTDGSVRIAAGSIANDNGLLQAGRDITLQTGRLSNDAGQVLAVGGALSIARDGAGHALDDLINNGGRLQAGSDLAVAAQQVESTQGTILTQGGDLSLTAGQGARMRQLDLTGGTLQAGRDLTLYTSALTGTSAVQTTRNLDFSTAQDVGSFLFSAGGDARLTLDSGWHINAGAGVIAGGGVTASAPDIANNGALIAGAALSLSTPGNLTNTGLISGTQGVQIALDGNLTNRQGAILSDAGDLTIGGRSGQFAGDITNSSGQILTGSAQGDVVISARSLTNDIIGGVTYQQGQVVYSQTYDQALANPPTPSNLGNTGQYYWGQKILAIQTPDGLLTPDGKPGSGYVLAALYGGTAASKVVVTGVGSLATASNAPSVISAGHDLIVTTSGAITNDASHLAAGNNMSLKGGSLNNVGYDTNVTYTLTCYNGNSCRWYMPPGEAANPWFPGGWQVGSGGGWPWPSQIWGSSRSNGLSGTIVAANSLIGDFAGQINNSTIIQHATAAQLAAASQYQGGTPGGVTAPGMNGHAVGGGALTLPGADRPTGNIDTGISGGAGAQGGISGTGLNGGFLTGSGQQATAQSGHDGLGAFDTGALAGGGNTDLAHNGGGSLTAPGQGNGLAGGRPETGGSITPGGLQPGQGGNGLSGRRPSSGGSAPSLAGGGVLPQEGVQTAADAAQNLRLPGFLNSADPSVMQVITSIPAGSALYVPNPSPQAHYLVETNPAYTSLTAFHGSQYLVDRLGKSPSDYTFLGDSYFDQQYVQQQIVSATGQTFLGGTFVNASSQMQALVTNGADQAQRLGLTFGQALSDEQKASLTQNIVWYVPVQVNGATVLAPKLYLAPGNVALTGGTIAAKDVSLAGSSVNNSGTISGSNSLSILARNGDITNTGTLAAGSVSLVAQNGSIINSATLNDYLVNGGNQGQLGSVGTITASGAASLSASNDITFNGGRLSSGGDLSMLAGNSLTLGAATVRQATAVKGANVSSAFSQTQNYTSSISAGGNAVLAALGGDLRSAGATIDSAGNMVLSAAKSLDLGSVTDSSSHDISGSKSGFLTHSSFTDKGSLSVERGSNVTSGGTLTGLSGGDMSLKGLIGAQGDVSLSAGGNLTLEATKTQSEASASHHVAGISLSSQGAQGTLGYGMRDDKSSSSSTVWTPSVLASLGGSVALNAGKALTIDGSALSAANDLTLSGSSVSLLAKENSQTQSSAHKEKSIGASIGLSPGSMVGQAVNGALAASKQENGVLGVLGGLQTAVGEAGAYPSGAWKNDIIGVQASVGFSTSKTASQQSQTTLQGSSASAGGTLAMVARGDNAADGQNGAISVMAGQLSGKDVVLAASKDITLQSGIEKGETEGSSSSFGISVGVRGSVGMKGTGASVSASAGGSTQHSQSDSTTHVVTTVNGTNSVTLTTPGTTTLDGAVVSGGHIGVQTGNLVIRSPQDTAHYESHSTSAGASIAVPLTPGAHIGGGASMAHTSITDEYRSTGKDQSGLYAGKDGLDVEVSGNTHLTGGVISSTAEAARNHFSTGSLTAESLENISRWSGTSVSAGGGYSKDEAPEDVLKTSTFAVGHEDHSESSVTQSVITGTIDVQSGSTSGHYSTDLAGANGHLDNDFDAKKLNTTLQIQTAGQTLAESAVEVGKQVYDKFQADRGASGGSGRNISGNNATQGVGSHNFSDGQAQPTDGSGRANVATGDLAASSGGLPLGDAQASDSNSGHGALLERPSEEITVRPPKKFWSDAQLTTQLEGYENWEVRGGRNKPYSGGMGSSAEAQALWNASENRLSQISNLPDGWGLIGSLPLAGMQAMDGKGMAALGTLALAGPNLVGLGSQFRVVALGAGGLRAGAVSGEIGSGVLALVQGGRGVVTVGDIAKALKSPLALEEAKNAFNTALKAYQSHQNVSATTGEQQSSDHTGKNDAQAQPNKQAASAEKVGADSLPPNNDDPDDEEKKDNFSTDPNQQESQPSPGGLRKTLGEVREQQVADIVGGRVSRDEIQHGSMGKTDIDVIAGNGDLVAVGGPAKAKNLGRLGEVLRTYAAEASKRGVQAWAYFEESTPESVLSLARRILGDHVKTFKDK
ncbi:two-partner secretion domain-containing protein [Asaia spathodeae]